MFDFEQIEDSVMVQGIDPTPEDGDITPLDWVEIGTDRVLFPVLAGMFVPVFSRLVPSATVPASGIGLMVLPGLVAMSFLVHPKNRFKWLFTLLAYVLGLFAGSWDWLAAMALNSALTGGLVLFGVSAIATAICLYIKVMISHG